MKTKHIAEYSVKISKNGERQTVKKHKQKKLQCDICLKQFPESKTYRCATEDCDIYETVCKACF